MKKTVYLLLSGMLPMCMAVMLGVGLAACSSDDQEFYNEEYGVAEELFEEEDVGQSYESPLYLQDDKIQMTFHLDSRTRNENNLTSFQEDEDMCLVFHAKYRFLPGAHTNFEFFKDIQFDKHFFAIYKSDGTIFKKVKMSDITNLLNLTAPPSLELIWCPELPSGDYYTKFTVKYNVTPDAEVETWKSHTFRIDFKVVANANQQ